jgi:hypothetical protein
VGNPGLGWFFFEVVTSEGSVFLRTTKVQKDMTSKRIPKLPSFGMSSPLGDKSGLKERSRRSRQKSQISIFIRGHAATRLERMLLTKAKSLRRASNFKLLCKSLNGDLKVAKFLGRLIGVDTELSPTSLSFGSIAKTGFTIGSFIPLTPVAAGVESGTSPKRSSLFVCEAHYPGMRKKQVY